MPPRVTLLTIVAKINWTLIITTAIGAGVAWGQFKQTTNHAETEQKQEQILEKQKADSIRQKAWRAKNDSIAFQVNYLYTQSLKNHR